MADIEKVNTGLKCLADVHDGNCAGCGYSEIAIYPVCVRQVTKDALSVIEELQAKIERLQQKTVNPIKPIDVENEFTYMCDSCRGELFRGEVLRDNFCPTCGGKVAWNEGDGK